MTSRMSLPRYYAQGLPKAYRLKIANNNQISTLKSHKILRREIHKAQVSQKNYCVYIVANTHDFLQIYRLKL